MTTKSEVTPLAQDSTSPEYQTIRRNRAVSLLETGRERIQAGWIKGEFIDDGNNVCALGSFGLEGVHSLEFEDQEIQDAVCFLAASIPEDFDDTCCTKDEKAGRIMDYNDNLDRTHEEVLNWFSRAIERAQTEPFSDD